MLFNSLEFLLFGAAFYVLWPILRGKNNARWLYIVIASFVFYGWWDWRFLILILLSGAIDYFASLGMEKFPKFRRSFLVCSVLGNVGGLVLFKYSGFLAENLEWILSGIGMHVCLKSQLPDMFLVVPVGISFYTFQSMSYTIDVFRGELHPTKNVLHFFAYLSMFPQLVAGPIVRARELLPQLMEGRKVTEEERWEGSRLIIQGYFKKVVIADTLAGSVNAAFGNPQMEISSVFWWIIITAFAFQIYCDFSGYSDIARGLARWMGYKFPCNFNHPYVSTSVREFWTRWHISLSTWFRDYVYIPLGGSRRSALRSTWNMWATMLVSGLWHGAAWTFVIWGGLHSIFLTIERVTHWPERIGSLRLGKAICTAIVIMEVWVAWVFFRAESLGQAVCIVKNMFMMSGGVKVGLTMNGVIVLGIAVLTELYVSAGLNVLTHLPRAWWRAVDVFGHALLIAACVFMRGPGSEFIYFQF